MSNGWMLEGDSKRLVPHVLLLLAGVFKENKQQQVSEANGKEGDWTVEPSRKCLFVKAGVIVEPGRESLGTSSLSQ